MTVNENLTNELDAWLEGVQVPIDIPVPDLKKVDLVDLGSAARRQRERGILRALRRKRRKKYTRRRGTVHPKKKEATKRRAYEARWAKDPIGCLDHSWGVWKLDKELWGRYIQPIWDKYLPSELQVRKYPGTGTRVNPVTVYSLDVVHKKLGVLYCGNDQLIYDLSCGSNI